MIHQATSDGQAYEDGPVLLIGASGMLGRAWSRLLDEQGIGYDAPPHEGRGRLDLTVPASISKWVTDRYSCVVNCAGWTDVDGAEAEPNRARLINGTVIGELADRCRVADVLAVHYSTDYVFSGCSTSPYLEDDPTEPLNEYGQSKLIGERRLLASECQNLLIRTSWLYAPWGTNFVRSIATRALNGESLRVVDDQVGRPTSCEHLARATLELMRKNCRGLYHVADGGQCSWFELAASIVKAVAPSSKVEPCNSESFIRPADRPEYSVLDLSKTEQLLGPMPSWEQNLQVVLGQLETQTA